MSRSWKNITGFILCAGWLLISVAFFAMLTSAGEANMDLEIGPFIQLHDDGAVFFCRGLIGFGIVMIVLFLMKRRIGSILAILWCAWWAIILSTALVTSTGIYNRIEIIVGVLFFAASAWFVWIRLKANPAAVNNRT